MFHVAQMQIYCYNSNDFQSLDEAIEKEGRVAALAVLLEVGSPENWPDHLIPKSPLLGSNQFLL